MVVSFRSILLCQSSSQSGVCALAFRTQLQQCGLPHLKALLPLLVISDLHHDLVPPLSAHFMGSEPLLFHIQLVSECLCYLVTFTHCQHYPPLLSFLIFTAAHLAIAVVVVVNFHKYRRISSSVSKTDQKTQLICSTSLLLIARYWRD